MPTSPTSGPGGGGASPPVTLSTVGSPAVVPLTITDDPNQSTDLLTITDQATPGLIRVDSVGGKFSVRDTTIPLDILEVKYGSDQVLISGDTNSDALQLQQLGGGLIIRCLDPSSNTRFSVAGDGSIVTAPPVPGTVALVSGTGAQASTTRDVDAVTPVTFNPTAGAAATCLVQVSPDGVTYTTLGTETEPAGIAFDGTIHLIRVRLPAGWRIKLTVTNATLGTTTFY